MTEGGRDAYLRASPVFAESFQKHFATQIAPEDHGSLARILSTMAAQHEVPDPAAQIED